MELTFNDKKPRDTTITGHGVTYTVSSPDSHCDSRKRLFFARDGVQFADVEFHKLRPSLLRMDGRERPVKEFIRSSGWRGQSLFEVDGTEYMWHPHMKSYSLRCMDKPKAVVGTFKCHPFRANQLVFSMTQHMPWHTVDVLIVSLLLVWTGREKRSAMWGLLNEAATETSPVTKHPDSEV